MNKKARKRLRVNLAHGATATPHAQAITAIIPREDVESVNVSRTLATLQVAAISASVAMLYRGKVHVGFGGYPDAAQDILPFAGVRDFLIELDAKFTHLLWFVETSTNAKEGNAFLLLLMRAVIGGIPSGGRGEMIGRADIRAFLDARLESMNDLARRLNIPAREVDSRRREVLNFFATYVPDLDRIMSGDDVRVLT
jgi:hypothetical protein